MTEHKYNMNGVGLMMLGSGFCALIFGNSG